MKLTHIKQVRGFKSLYSTFLYVTLLPLFLFGIVLMIFNAMTLSANIKEEVCENLKNVGIAVLTAYDALYEGDYNVLIVDNDVEFYKGDEILSGKYDILDNLKSETGIDISFFFYDTRVLTTVKGSNGERLLNTGVNATVLNNVIESEQSNFYSDVYIGENKYFAYYQPIFSKDGQTCLGMIGMATSADVVHSMIVKSVVKILIIMIIVLVLTAFCIMHFTSGIIDIIKRIMIFLGHIASGKLDAELDEAVYSREDELGEMGKLTLELRMGLRKSIEKDALTGIYNRRYGRNKLAEYMKNGLPFCVAIGDIDFFKKFNDKFGHECGDVVLKAVAKTLSEGMRTCGFAARWGGEEFLLVFENMEELTSGVMLEKIVDDIRSNLIEYNGEVHSVTMSFGLVEGRYENTLDENINRADDKLYEAKNNGRNQIAFEAN